MVWNRFSLPRCWAISVVLAGTLLLPGCENRAPAPSPAGGSGEDTPTETDHTTPAELTGEQKEHPENRLAHETSPYLLLHAHNPVDWYPWGEEALAKAREENKPIFLSVGYSSCYWCHVMERESFMDEEIAAFMNEHFVCIKVDREERPDIDDMAIASLMNLHQNPGWPVSLFLTPDGFPFAGTSYMPARDGDREGMPGFLSMIRFVAQNWGEEEAKIRDDARRLSKYIASTLNEEGTFGSYRVGEALSRRALGDLASGYDAEYGGFFFSPVNPQLPKFPTPAYMSLLQRQIARPGGSQSLTMLVGTLGNMARGGIYDHVGGGFHRYSTDRYWEIPHFEKMLYDNGQLATAYAQAYEVTRDEAFSEVAAGICDFVLRDMTSPAGGFYTAIDAETNRIEGEYYRWSQEQLAAALTPAELELAEAIYGLHEEPNFEGFYVLAIPAPLGEIAAQLGLTADELRAQKVALDSKLLAARQQREMPLLDTKILTDWNGLMIRGLAETGRVLEEPRYTEAAARAADFLLANARDEQGRLWHVYTDGQAHVPGYLDDYAFFIDGLIALHESTGEQRWLAAADELAALQMELFYDEPLGGFFFTSTQHEEIIARGKDFYDRALPSGNAVSVGNLLYLAEALDRPQYLERAGETVHAAGIVLNLSPLDATRMVVEALRWKDAIGESETELVDTQPAAGHVQPSIEPLAPTDP